jgi:hypothetical protein
VSASARRVTVMAAPYNAPTPVIVHSRPVLESFAPTAFAGKQPERIYSTRDHKTERVIGRVT